MAVPSQRFEVQLTRPNNSVPWGFRLQGGADFSTPLSIQLVQPSSVADQVGLMAGDGVLQINSVATETLDHELAKAEIIRAGNEVNFLIARGAVTVWKPKVTPMSELKPGELDTHTLPGEAPPIQRTSLATNRPPAVQHVGSAYNRSARPFKAGSSTVEEESHISVRDSFPSGAPNNASYPHRSQAQQEYLEECGGQVPNVSYDPRPAQTPPAQPTQPSQPNQPKPGVVHAQYNTPMGVYSPKNINDSFSQQATAMKDDFGNMSLHDKSETTINNNNGSVQHLKVNTTTASAINDNGKPALSPVQRALQEEDQEEQSMLYRGGRIQSRSFKLLEQELESGNSPNSLLTSDQPSSTNSVMPQGMRSVQAPTVNPNMRIAGPRWKQPTESCYVCKNPITGVFVKVKDFQLHADCLRCAQCRRNLKNIGYIWVGDKLYCVQHARELTRPPGGGYTAYVIDAPDQ